jgi:UDP-N-acetyl-D-mannosaminuronate dehydrogenase
MSVVAVLGLGYVRLPLAVEFGKKQTTIVCWKCLS